MWRRLVWLLPHSMFPPIISFLHECDLFVKIEEPILIRANSFKCIVYTSIHAWCSHCLGFGTHIMTCVRHTQGHLNAPNILCAPPIPASFPAPGSRWWFYYIRTFAFYGRSHRRSPYRMPAFSDNWLLCKMIQPLPDCI